MSFGTPLILTESYKYLFVRVNHSCIFVLSVVQSSGAFRPTVLNSEDERQD